MRAALFFVLLASAGCDGVEPARDPRLEGLWRAESIDGKPVGQTEYLIRIRGGRPTGGNDGCNSWGYDMTRPPEANGTRSVVSTCMGCPGLVGQDAYWRALGNGNIVPVLAEDGALRLRAGGSEILARRAPVQKGPAASPRP
jgi:hypothetical protein